MNELENIWVVYIDVFVGCVGSNCSTRGSLVMLPARLAQVVTGRQSLAHTPMVIGYLGSAAYYISMESIPFYLV